MISRSELARTVATVWSAPVPDAIVDRLVVLCRDAIAVHPIIDELELVTAIASRCPTDNALAYVDRCHGDELGLALAAARGAPGAIEMIEHTHRRTIEGACRRFANDAHAIDDLWQTLRERLFVGARPKIREYSGQGLLGSWLRVTAIRLFLDVLKRRDRPRELLARESDSLELCDPADLGLELVKTEACAAVADAMRVAVRELAPSERHILCLYFVTSLTIDQISATLGIHRATAARRVGRARDQLAEDVRRALTHSLELQDHDDADDVIGLVTSRLDISVSELLAFAA